MLHTSMPSDPTSISDWKKLASSDPEQAAATFFDKLNKVPEATRRSVFAALPDLSSLSATFEKSIRVNKTLSGVPFLLKDLYDFPGYQTTASSRFLARIRPNPTIESTLSQSFRKLGAVFAGKTHLNEFAYGLSGENPTYGNCPHPIFTDRLSGGSSSGSAWAVRSGIVPIATGTDTGGSIRVPAAWCGIFGLRLSPNNWSSTGCFPLAPSFDTAGWFTATSEDMLTSIQTLLAPKPTKKRTLKGVSLLGSVSSLSPEFRAKALDTLERINAQSDPVVTEEYRQATRSVTQDYSILQSLEALAVHKPWIDTYQHLYDPAVWNRIDRARHWSKSQIENARRGETAIKDFFDTSFASYDFIVLPATQSPAIKASEHTDQFRSELLSITAPGSFARCPVLTIPIHLKNGESQGLQILYSNDNSDLPIRILKLLETSASR